MGLSDLVNITISKATATLTRPGFGTPLIAAYHTVFPERVRRYTDLSQMVTDGFAVTHPAYLAAAALKAQDPSVSAWKVGRRALAPTQTVTLKCLTGTAGQKYTVKVASTTVNRTVPGASSANAEATAIAALIDADAVVSATASTDTITITAAAGVLFDVSDWNNNFQIKNTTADPGIATDLAAIWVADTDWYALALDSNSKAEIVAAAAWVESNKRIMAANTSDTECGDVAVTNDVLSTLKGSSYARTATVFTGKKLMSFGGAAWLGGRLTATPGSDTWAHKTLVGVPVDDLASLSATQEAQIKLKGGNTYTTMAGANITFPGQSAAGEFMDTTRFVDWLQAEMQIDVFALFVNNAKIPFTDAGVDVVRGTVLADLKKGVNAGGLNPGDGKTIPAPYVTVPAVADVSTVDRANRNLPDVKFGGRLAGAIHSLTINGTVSV